ncbi:RhuM family protein [Synergistes jonesii]|uniref:RhuM family protein n=1 Tax=Synergistes jonesii TaxID=2754 RepID=UPI00248E1E18|nr:RhuM family protein [Synergistes jonesii]
MTKRGRLSPILLSAIIAVGNKVDSPRAVRFRKWANHIIEEFTVKGFAMDDGRLKNGGTVLTKDYFKEQLERIREIRLSERRFYQKIIDIYAASIYLDLAELRAEEKVPIDNGRLGRTV